MKPTIFSIFLATLVFTLSCGTRRRLPPTTPEQRIEQSIYGQWNAYDVQSPSGRSFGIPYNLLIDNEQGFELREAGVYMPRYYNGQSNAYSTNYNITRYWGVKEEKYLYFSRRPNEMENPDFTWEILQLSEQELWLKDQDGQTVKFRRQDL